MRKRRLLILIGVIFWIGFLSFLYRPERLYSAFENRYLKTFILPTQETFFSGQWSKNFDEAMNDQIVFRDAAVSFKTNLDLLLGRQDNGRVYFGKDDYLFQMESKNEAIFQNNLDYLYQFAKTQTIPIDFIPVYSAMTILDDKLPKYVESTQRESMGEIQTKLGHYMHIIDLYEPFQAATIPLYYRTDHHWTTQGAFLAYQIYGQQLGWENQIPDLEMVSNHFYGTSYHLGPTFHQPYDEIWALKDQTVKIQYPDGTWKESYYDKLKLDLVDQYSYFFGGNFSRLNIFTSTTNNQSLLVIKDSYANCFIPFLHDAYQKITVIDPRYYNGNWTELLEEHYDRVLILMGIDQLTEKAIN